MKNLENLAWNINPAYAFYATDRNMKRKIHSLLYHGLLLLGTVLLSGCLPDIFGAEAHYGLAGLEDNKPLKDNIGKFLSERAGAIDADRKGGGREVYEERQLQADLKSKLASEGYYDAAVSYAAGGRPWTGTYTVDEGARYRIRRASVVPAKDARFLGADLAGAPLAASGVLAAQKDLQDGIGKGKCYFNLDVANEVTLDARHKTADVVFRVTAGPQAKMGPAIFTGNEKVRTSYLQKMAGWKDGDCFARGKIDDLRAALFESGLFSAADVVLPDRPGRDGRVPVTLRVKERAFRSLSAGVSYYTDEGLGLTLGWKHRNLWGAGESFDSALKLSQREQTLGGSLTKPFFLRKDQSLSFNAGVGHEDTEAYTRAGFDAGAALKRAFSKRLSGSTGVSLSLSRVKDKILGDGSTFYLVSLPQELTYDSRDNILDAHRGVLLTGKVEPFADVRGESSPFGRAEAAGQAYRALGEKTVAALRVKAGSIIGPGAQAIPATKRFYAGGGGSVRGFGYQKIGPQKNGEPEGGRSLIEASGELRYKVTDTVGVVAFLDAGSVGASPVADFNHLSAGGGGGLRYYTDFGPVRLDVGVPLNNKDVASAAYQLYISFGQAF